MYEHCECPDDWPGACPCPDFPRPRDTWWVDVEHEDQLGVWLLDNFEPFHDYAAAVDFAGKQCAEPWGDWERVRVRYDATGDNDPTLGRVELVLHLASFRAAQEAIWGALA